MNEIWKPIIGFEYLYKISNYGVIKNRNTNRIIKPYLTRGYNMVGLYKNNKRHKFYVHRLVWESFNGKTDLQIDHIIEGNKLDNRLCNLQAISHRKNQSKYQSSLIKTSIFTGVSWDKFYNKWVAQIYIDGKNIKLGKFLFETEAHRAYQKALTSLQPSYNN